MEKLLVKMKLKNETYDALKWICLVALPAIGVFYFALAEIWNFPYAEQVVGTLTAIETLLGALLGISCYQYNKKESEEE